MKDFKLQRPKKEQEDAVVLNNLGDKRKTEDLRKDARRLRSAEESTRTESLWKLQETVRDLIRNSNLQTT